MPRHEKLSVETNKLQAEAWKLMAEERKFTRDRELAVWQVFGIMLGAAAGFVAVAAFVRLIGG